MADHDNDLDLDRDHPDDSSRNRHKPDSTLEEVSAFGQRVKGAVKEELGDLADDRGMQEKGRRENAAGRERQRRNDGA
jgi:uncharacterized protein YjbJ (UPF0337 family)